MSASKYYIVVHGGCCDSSNPEGPNLKRRAQIDELLQNLADKLGAQLARGEKAIDVVQQAVAELEDNALFNAGKGAVLAEDGENEVRNQYRQQVYQKWLFLLLMTL